MEGVIKGRRQARSVLAGGEGASSFSVSNNDKGSACEGGESSEGVGCKENKAAERMVPNAADAAATPACIADEAAAAAVAAAASAKVHADPCPVLASRGEQAAAHVLTEARAVENA